MSEKGELPQDAVSLPPTYAPSEAYTDSPPPAYRGVKSSKVQIVKLVCITVVASCVIVGFFVLTSNYLNARACTCPEQTLDGDAPVTFLQTAGFLQPPPAAPAAEALMGKQEEAKQEEEQQENEVQINSLDAGDDTVLAKEVPLSEQEVGTIVEEVVKAEEELQDEMQQVEEEVEVEEEALKDILNAQADHMKKIRLPIDLILGNPALAGRDVNCEVERRRQPLAPGVMSQAIIVTCEDDTPEARGPTPPMALLGNIMKMLASRSGPRPVPMSQPRLVSRGPGSQPRHISKSMRPPTPPFPAPEAIPFPFPPKRLVPISLRGPLPMMVPRPAPEEGPRDRMLPPHLQPVVKLTPRLLSASPRSQGAPISLAGLQRGALPQARARGIPSPVNLAPFPFRPAPPALLPHPFNAMERLEPHHRHPVTHMEIAAPPEPRDTPEHRGHHQQEEEEQEREDEPQQVIREFGPPRHHTLIPADIQKLAPPQHIRVHTLPQEHMMPPKPIAIVPQVRVIPMVGPPHKDSQAPQVRIIPFPGPPPHQDSVNPVSGPPPQDSSAPQVRLIPGAHHRDTPVHQSPSFAPEGLRGPPPEINPEAEFLAPPPPQGHPQDRPQDRSQQPPPRKHHLLMVN